MQQLQLRYKQGAIMDRNDAIKKLEELMDGARFCSVATLDDNGRIVTRPMAIQNKNFDGKVWLFTNKGSSKVAQVNNNPQANVFFENHDSYVSISGEASFMQDAQKAEELWNPAMKGWFPDGPESDDLLIMCIEATSAQYWDSPNNKLITLFAYAKATVTGERPTNVGDNEVVEL